MTLKFGRNFSKDIPADSARVILNETAVKAFGWKVDESVIGKKVVYPGNDNIKFEVIGVTDDFHFWTLDAPIEPMAVFHIKYRLYGNAQCILVRIDGSNREGWQNTIALIKNKWKDFAGDKPFHYSFVDQAFANTFKSSEQFGKSLAILSALAILIASLGLLGMIIYTLEQRTKEIGIRVKLSLKCFPSIAVIILIFKEYSKLITVAFIISAPVAYWLVNQWLQDFEYRIIPSPVIFVLAGAGTLLLAAVITSYHSIKAALTNPVDVLRDE